MKLLTIVVPCYNSQEYLRKCLNSCLCGGEKLEVLIVNDGSKDNTLKIAQEYQLSYPNIFIVIDKENGGHGSAINEGIKRGSGLFFKVLDSDDWFDETALLTFLDKIEEHYNQKINIDIYFTNYVHEHVYTNKSILHEYTNMTSNQITNWNSVRHFSVFSPIMIHAFSAKLSILKQANISLPLKISYDDLLFSYMVMPLVKDIYYLPINLYRYFIGRPDQSINVSISVKKYKDYLFVLNEAFYAYSYKEIKKLSKGLRNITFKQIEDIYLIAILFTTFEYSKDKIKLIRSIKREYKKHDIKLYRHLFFFTMVGWIGGLPYFLQRIVYNRGYKYVQKKLGY
ncbi:MAG: glycosyltransferase family 2 protein [Bacillales bacterium]|jgi:glycosyltransferase involved in cell wall biosynthesis|nr:glycosyltransferase family 2 protein [Bacillales bacterium]